MKFVPTYEYPGGILPHEMQTIERFERDVLPYTMKHGPEIGELAIQGDADAEEVIRRQRMFCVGMPHLRDWNLKLLIAALKRWEAKRMQ